MRFRGKILLILFAASCLPNLFVYRLFAVSSLSDRKNGVGLTVGNVSGVSYKRFLHKRKTAVDSTFSVSDGKLYLLASYLWHDYEALPPLEEGQIPLVYGATAGIYSGKAALGGVIGAVYIFKENYPFDIFLHLFPLIIFDSSVGLNFQGALGARYYFK